MNAEWLKGEREWNKPSVTGDEDINNLPVLVKEREQIVSSRTWTTSWLKERINRDRRYHKQERKFGGREVKEDRRRERSTDGRWCWGREASRCLRCPADLIFRSETSFDRGGDRSRREDKLGFGRSSNEIGVSRRPEPSWNWKSWNEEKNLRQENI